MGARLLMTDTLDEAGELARQLHALNADRQALERTVLEAAQRAVEPQLAAGRSVLLVAAEGWHPGIVGIVASRLTDRFHRPVAVLGIGDGIAKGSARSVDGFDLGTAVIAARQQGILMHGGGHAMAAGMTLEEAELGRFHDFLQAAFAVACGQGVPPPRPLQLDGALSVAAAKPVLAEQVARLAPYGAGNMEPAFALTDARVMQARIVGDGHVSCVLTGAVDGRVKAIAFRCGSTPLGRELLEARVPLRLAGRLRLDSWQGRPQACFEIDDAAPGA
jgi:single-stranded-DNA-specific exonuclease